MTKKEEQNRKLNEARKLFHEIWTSNVGAQEYDKKKWMDLQWALQELGVPV
jgi:hypothetical protein